MVTKSFTGKVHPHQPYDGFRPDDGPCGRSLPSIGICNQMSDEEVHLRIVNERSPWRKLCTLEVYYEFTPGQYVSGMHVATVCWQSENESSWFSGWMAPHNSPSNFVRADMLDVWTADDMGRWIARLSERNLNYEKLKELGIRSN